jgi:two-component system sensor histidine kinase YesM
MKEMDYNGKQLVFIAGLLFLGVILILDLCLSFPVPLGLCAVFFLVAWTAVWVVRFYGPAAALMECIQQAGKNGGWKKLRESAVWNRTGYGAAVRAALNGLVSEVTKKETAVSDEQRAKLLALQSQINPHFLYNTLDCIRGQAMLDNNREIAEMLEALSDFFRYSISHRDSMVTLQDELNSASNYMLIQRYRFNDRYGFEVHILGEKNAVLNCYIPKLILQPIIENAILHGLESRSRGLIRIRIDFSRDLLHITVSDDGEGMTEDQLLTVLTQINGDGSQPGNVSGAGIALPNINRRIRMLFGERYGIHVYSTRGKGTDVEVIVPRILNKDEVGL